MDAAGLDVQILSNVPGVEAIETPLAVELARQANDAVVDAVTGYPDRFLGFATLPMRDPTPPRPSWSAPCATTASSAR